MSTVHNLGFPRIGAQRELKSAVESFWTDSLSENELHQKAAQLRKQHWLLQQKAGVDVIPVGDFSLYDHVLDTSFLLGNVPQRFAARTDLSELQQYFGVARGYEDAQTSIRASEMTKWFDTNYHYIVPELHPKTAWKLNPQKLLNEVEEAQALGINAKPVILGPLSYLWLGKAKSAHFDPLALLSELIPLYQDLLTQLTQHNIDWVQIDEPILALDLPETWQNAFRETYTALHTPNLKTLLAIYFGSTENYQNWLTLLPVAGIHLDIVRGDYHLPELVDAWPKDKILSLGIIDGRNIWRTPLKAYLKWLKPVYQTLGDRLWLAPSCSLLHVPVSLNYEVYLDTELKSWLAFAEEKLQELNTLSTALNKTQSAVAQALNANTRAITSRRKSQRIHNHQVQERLLSITPKETRRISHFDTRYACQQKKLNLPLFPTTTIGSFPQTQEIRKTRAALRKKTLSIAEYESTMRKHIQQCIRTQEELDLDVLVHGEAERNDMVEYFGEHLEGFAFTHNGWVQSYGSRCVKPPIIYGDISRKEPMTVNWIRYAQSLTPKPVKGMLTGPVTILQWSFVRNDQPRQDTAKQIALALRDEVADLEKAKIGIIQVDEPALREGLPLRKKDWKTYTDWAVQAFKLATSGVKDSTQIHTHMCYSEFNDIIEVIAALDADVITIENARSELELLSAFKDFRYPNGIGPGVFDIHSPNIPDAASIANTIEALRGFIQDEHLWVNPDCGLKTRQWDEVTTALKNMVQATSILRNRVLEEQLI